MTNTEIARLHLYRTTGLIFIKIPKTGGRSVCEAVYGTQVPHQSWRDVRGLAPRLYRDCLSFAVLRDPIDRFLSAYDYLRHGGRNDHDAAFGRREVAPHDANAFAARLCDPHERAIIMSYFHFQPQSRYLLAGNRRCMVRRIIPFERLSEELGGMLGRPTAQIPRVNVTPGERTRRQSLTPASLAALSVAYREDLLLRRRLGFPRDARSKLRRQRLLQRSRGRLQLLPR